jgi:hypothetical protein
VAAWVRSDPDANGGRRGTDWWVPLVRGLLQWVPPIDNATSSQNRAVRAQAGKGTTFYGKTEEGIVL